MATFAAPLARRVVALRGMMRCPFSHSPHWLARPADAPANAARSLSTSTSSAPSDSSAVLLSGYSSSASSLSTVGVSRVVRPSASQLLPRSVLLRVLAVSLNPLDVMAACGYGRSLLSLSHRSASSAVELGRDAVGLVEAVGSGVWRYAPGHTLWVSRDPLAGGTFANYIAVDVRECGEAPLSLAATSAVCYPFIATTLWTALVSVAGMRPISLRHWHGQQSNGRDGDGGSSAGRVLVHGAAGPLGLLACQLLQGWGYTVTATCKPAQDSTQLARFAQHVVTTDEDEEAVQEKERPLSSPAPGWLSSVPHVGSYCLFLDCVGGGQSESAALSSLSSPGGHFVTLRGSLLPTMDAAGLLLGGVSSAARLADRKAAFSLRGLRYDWAINRCSSDALRYIGAAFDQGLLAATPPVRVLPGIESVPAAMRLYATERPQGKVVVDLQQRSSASQAVSQRQQQQHSTAATRAQL